MTEKFQNLTVDFRQLLSVPIQDRVALAKSAASSDIFGNMTPTEIARLFPSFYRNGITTSSQGNSSWWSSLTGWFGSGDSNSSSGGNFPKNNETSGQSTAHPATPMTLAEEIAMGAAIKRGKLAGSFQQQAPIVMNRLMRDFGITKEQAAGVLGNLGHESRGLTAGIQEINPRAGRGGLGWAQWTGPRRVAFEEFLNANGLDASDPEANYAFLTQELRTTHAYALDALRQAKSVEEATYIFENTFEKAADDAKHYDRRNEYAFEALGYYDTFEPNANTNEQTDAALEPLAGQETFVLTPENIGSYTDLDPKVKQYADTLSDSDRRNFYENMSTLGSVDEINRIAKKHTIQTIGTASPIGGEAVVPDSYERLSDYYKDLQKVYPDKIDVNSDFWTKIDPSLAANKELLVASGANDGKGGYINRDTLISTDTTLRLARKYGLTYRPVSGGGGDDEHSVNHGGRGRDTNYSIDYQFYDSDGKPVHIGKLPTEMKKQFIKASLGGGSNRLGITIDNHTASFHNQSDPHMPNAAWGYDGSSGYNRSTLESSQEGRELLQVYDQNVTQAGDIKPELLDEIGLEKLPKREGNTKIDPYTNKTISDTELEPLITSTETATPVVEPPQKEEPAQNITPEPNKEEKILEPTEPEPPKMALGGFIPEKDNLSVVKEETGETVAKINEGEVKEGIKPEGSGLRVESNRTRLADDLISKYENDTQTVENDVNEEKQPSQAQPVTGGMTSPTPSDAGRHIAYIPHQNTLSEAHGSLLRAYDLDRRRFGYGNIS